VSSMRRPQECRYKNALDGRRLRVGRGQECQAHVSRSLKETRTAASLVAVTSYIDLSSPSPVSACLHRIDC
jgi:hypothetical protein